MKRTRRKRTVIHSSAGLFPFDEAKKAASSFCVLVILLACLVAGPALRRRTEHAEARPQGEVSQAFKAPIDYKTAARYARENKVDPRPHTGGYHRDRQFGDWRKQGGVCPYATTRDLILRRDLTDVRIGKGCKVESGDFRDPYTGRSLHFIKGPETSQQVQIDHIVSVHDAWASGLWKQDRAGERAGYYNDPDVLQASDGPSNQAKGDGIDWQAPRNPVWMPENRGWHCDYMAKRAYIKHKYQLSMTPAEQEQALSVLKSCADRTTPEEKEP